MDYEKLFEKKSGFTVAEFKDDPTQYRFDTPYGFFVAELGGEDMHVTALSGNGAILVPYIEDKARALGYKKIKFKTKRNPKAWERKYGYKLVAYVMEKEL